jgi:hypothetical protein
MRGIIQSNKMNYIAYVLSDDAMTGYAYRYSPKHVKYGNKMFLGLWKGCHTELSDDNEYMELVAAGSLIEFGQRPYQLDAVNLKVQLEDANAEIADLKKQLAVANAQTVDITKLISTI